MGIHLGRNLVNIYFMVVKRFLKNIEFSGRIGVAEHVSVNAV